MMASGQEERTSTFEQVATKLGQIRAECDSLSKALDQLKNLIVSERVVESAVKSRRAALVCSFISRFLGEVHAHLSLVDSLPLPLGEAQLGQIATITDHLTQLTHDQIRYATNSNHDQSCLDGLSGASRWLRALGQPLASQVEQATKLLRSVPNLCRNYFDPTDYATFTSSNLPTALASLEAFLSQLNLEQLSAQPAGVVELVTDYLAQVCCRAIMCLRQPRAFVGQPQSYATYASNLVYELDSLAGNSVVSLAASYSPPHSSN